VNTQSHHKTVSLDDLTIDPEIQRREGIDQRGKLAIRDLGVGWNGHGGGAEKHHHNDEVSEKRHGGPDLVRNSMSSRT